MSTADASSPTPGDGISDHTYQRANLLVAVAVSSLGLALIWSGIGYGPWDIDRPGPGFFPSIMGGVLLVLGSIWVWQSHTNRLLREGESSTPDARGWLNMGVAIAAVLLFGLTVGYLGFMVTFFGMNLALFWVVANQRWWRAGIAALGTTAFVAVVFRVLLGVPLPTSEVPFLRALGA